LTTATSNQLPFFYFYSFAERFDDGFLAVSTIALSSLEASRGTHGKRQAHKTEKETNEPGLRELFTSIMSKEGNAPIKWIIQVAPVPKQKCAFQFHLILMKKGLLRFGTML
jgi:hypothetical protein